MAVTRIPTRVALPTVGHLVAGFSVFVLLFAGPRLLGADRYSVLAVAWTLVGLAGVGLAEPGAQTVTRVLASGGTGVVRAVGGRLAVVLVALLPLLLLVPHGLLRGSTGWAVAVAAGAFSWLLASLYRGVLAGGGRYTAYAASLVAEGATRVVFVAAAASFRDVAEEILMFSLAAPLLVSFAVALAAVRRQPPAADPLAPATPGHNVREQLSITAVAVLGQVSLTTAPLWLETASTDAALAGAFVTATSFLRVPVLLVGGLGTVALAEVSRAHARGETGRARHLALRSVLGAAVAGVITVAALVASAPVGLRLLYGETIGIGLGALAAIGLSTVLAMAAGVAAQIAFGLRRSGRAVAAGAGAAAVSTLLYVLSDGSVAVIAAGLVAGQATYAAGLVGVLARPGSVTGAVASDAPPAGSAGPDA